MKNAQDHHRVEMAVGNIRDDVRSPRDDQLTDSGSPARTPERWMITKLIDLAANRVADAARGIQIPIKEIVIQTV